MERFISDRMSYRNYNMYSGEATIVSIKEQQPLMLVDIFKTVQTNTRLNGGKKNCSQFCIHKNVSGQLNLQNVFINFHQACTKPYS